MFCCVAPRLGTLGLSFCVVARDVPNLMIIGVILEKGNLWKSGADGNCVYCFTRIRIGTLAERKSGTTVFFLPSKLSTPSLGSPRNLSFVVTGLVVAEGYRYLS